MACFWCNLIDIFPNILSCENNPLIIRLYRCNWLTTFEGYTKGSVSNILPQIVIISIKYSNCKSFLIGSHFAAYLLIFVAVRHVSSLVKL